MSWLWLIPAFAAGAVVGVTFMAFSMVDLMLKLQDARDEGRRRS